MLVFITLFSFTFLGKSFGGISFVRPYWHDLSWKPSFWHLLPERFLGNARWKIWSCHGVHYKRCAWLCWPTLTWQISKNLFTEYDILILWYLTSISDCYDIVILWYLTFPCLSFLYIILKYSFSSLLAYLLSFYYLAAVNKFTFSPP